MSSEKHEPLFPPVKETTKTDLYKNLPEVDTSQNKKVCIYIYLTNNILSSIFSHSLHQESDQILHALKPCSIYGVARFFSLHDLQVTERQKIQFLSLAAASGKNYLLDYELYSILIVYRPSISN